MKKRLPEFLAILAMSLPAFLATEAIAAGIKVTYPSRGSFEVSGGSDEHPWHIQYGRASVGANPSVLTLNGPASDAYFSHGTWLRRIDTEKGIITGRWHFPGSSITALTLKDDHIQVEVEDRISKNRSFRRVIDFNAGDPHIPYWPGISPFSDGIPEREMNCFCGIPNIKPGQAQAWLPEAENAVQRDSLSPWLRIALAHIYQSLGKPEANQLLDGAPLAGPADFGELFRLSSRLDTERRPEAAREAFERGYENYWQRGNDPRLVAVLFTRIFSYPFPQGAGENKRAELIERGYRIAPWVEGADYAWGSYARLLNEKGNSGDAATWSQRAADSVSNSLYPMSTRLQKWLVIVNVSVPATFLAALLYLAALFFRYLPERRIQLRGEEQTGARRRWAFFNVEYWSRTDRASFLMVLIVGWLSIGLAGSFISLISREATIPLSEGSGKLAGPVTISYLEGLQQTPERDLVLAIAYQQDGQSEKAESLYRQLPQFPESWNNLGVLLKDSGREPEARQAFERASQLNPQMTEARFNLGNPPTDFWTDSHQRYLPNRGMLTPPRRERIMHLLGFGSVSQIAYQALLGPVSAARSLNLWFGRLTSIRPPTLSLAVAALLVILFTIAVAVSVMRPLRDVTQAPPRYQIIIEALLPGTATAWRLIGGIALTAWTYAVLQLLALATRSRFPYFPFFGFPNIRRAFGIPIPVESNLYGLEAVQISYVLWVGLVVFLYAVNATLIWYSRPRQTHAG